MGALNLTKMNPPEVFLKKFCLDTNCWFLNIKILRTTSFQSSYQQLKAAKNSAKKKKKKENIKQNKKKTNNNNNNKKQKQHKKNSRISLSFHPIFLMNFLHSAYLFRRLKTCFARIYLGNSDCVICYMPFVFKSCCLL